jgi:hypothetical protein
VRGEVRGEGERPLGHGLTPVCWLRCSVAMATQEGGIGAAEGSSEGQAWAWSCSCSVSDGAARRGSEWRGGINKLALVGGRIRCTSEPSWR